MNIVFVAHSSFNENFVVGSHHLSRAMAAKGYTVWHIGPPVTPFHLLQAGKPAYRERLRRSLLDPETRGSLTSMEPLALVPWQIARRFLARGNLFVKTSNLARRLSKVFAPGEIDILIIDDPRFAGLEQKLKPKALFYRLTDFYAEMKGDRRSSRPNGICWRVARR
jgi:teichuronic acid biosynthesis glycosyltransferase TuaH